MRSNEGHIFVSFALIQALELYPPQTRIDVLKCLLDYAIGKPKPWLSLQDADAQNLAQLACAMQTRQGRRGGRRHAV